MQKQLSEGIRILHGLPGEDTLNVNKNAATGQGFLDASFKNFTQIQCHQSFSEFQFRALLLIT
jgi:hypothetical protein